MFSKTIVTIVLLAAFFFSSAAIAETGKLRYDWKLDIAATSVSMVGWAIMEGAMNKIAPASCRWCQVGSFDRWGRNNLKWSNIGAANSAAYVTGYGLSMLSAFGLDAIAASREKELSNFWPDALIIAESAAVSSLACQIVKVSVGRERPRSYFGQGAQIPSSNTSFYSGHTTLAFSLAVSSGTVAWMRGYEMAPWIWGSGLAIAATTAYLSVAADRHYLTDVITGAGLGSAFGFAIPYLFHRPRGKKENTPMFSALPVPGGGVLTASMAW